MRKKLIAHRPLLANSLKQLCVTAISRILNSGNTHLKLDKLPQSLQEALLKESGKHPFNDPIPNDSFSHLATLDFSNNSTLGIKLPQLIQLPGIQNLVISNTTLLLANKTFKPKSFFSMTTIVLDGRSFLSSETASSLLSAGFKPSPNAPICLRSLSLGYVNFEGRQLTSILSTIQQKLQALTLYHITIPNNWFSKELSLKNLTTANLSGTPMSISDFHRFCQSAPHLKHLDCSDSHELQKVSFKPLPSLRQLTSFQAKFVPFSSFEGISNWAPALKFAWINITEISTQNDLIDFTNITTFPTVNLHQNSYDETDKSSLIPETSAVNFNHN